MVKNLRKVIFTILLANAFGLNAQTFFNYPVTTASGSNSFPLNSTTSNKVQTIYKPGIFKDGSGTPVGAGNNITKIYFKFATANATTTYTSITISMAQNVGVDSVHTSSTFNTGVTPVYSQTNVQLTGIVANQFYGFTLSTPFAYDPTLSLVIELKSNHTVSGGNSSANVSVAPGNSGSRRRYGAYASATGSIGSGFVITAMDVLPNAACTAPPTAGTNLVSPSSGLCAGGNLSLDLTGNSTGSGQTYVWKRSSTLGGTYTAISGVLTSPAFNYSPSDSGYYRCTLFCSGDSSTTAATKVNVVAPFPAGTYTINSAVATGGTNYQTFTAAVNALACGIAGPVVFNVVPGSGPYNEQFSIPSLIGSSSTNTVTFNGNGDTITSAGSAGYWGTIDLNGADYVRIKNLNIFATAATNAFGIRMGGGADNNIIDSCNIYVLPTATGSTVIGVVISGSPILYSTAGPNGKNNEIRNCNINGGYIGVSLYGESASNINNQNNNVRNCRITDYYIYGVYNIYQGNSFISNNIISRPTRTGSTTTYGVMLTTGCSNITVERNRIRNLFTSFPASASTCYPFYCILTTAGAGNENRFINNVISDIVHAGPIYAIYLSSGNFIKAYNNTIVLDDATATTTSPTYGIYSTSTTAANLDFRNNSIHISRGGAGTKACLYYRSAFITSDNNNLFMASTAGTNNIGNNTTLYASLATWQTANGGTWDANSVSANPLYSNAAVYNYIPTTTALNNAADSIPSFVSIDIDSVVRSVTPDIGAHEFTVGTLDAKIDWVSPMGAQTAGNKNVRAKITNMSVDPITSLIANYTDGTTVYTDTFTSLALLTGDTAILNFTNLYNLTTAVSLRGFITSVNGGLDFVRGNDTTAWQDLCIAMAAGTYTINSALPDTGSNFSTFNNAVTAMSCGIAGPVTFNVAPGSGPYAEQVDIPAIPGSSSVNTVTINGNNNELIFAGGNGLNFATLNLNGTRHLRINNLNITGTALTNCYGIHLMGNAAFNTFDSCTVAVSTTAAVTSVMGVSISASKTSYTTQGINANNNLFNRCTITGGYYAMVFYGYSTLDTNNRNNSITNCIVRDAYSYGIYNIYQGYSTISNNVIERPTRATSTTTAGVFLTTNCVNILVEKNRIRNLFGAITGSTSTAYGIYCSSSAGSSGLENKFINNIISDIKSNGAIYAIYPVGSTYVQIYHNTINLDDQTATAGTTYGIYSTAATATGVDIKNNIVNITRGGTGTKYCIFLTGLIATSDNNDLYINSPAGTNAVGFNVSAYTTLADWQAANGSIWDQSSVGLQPNFLSIGTNNFKPTNPLLDNLGTNVGIATDIVGNSRSVSTPDIGAYEIIPIPIDLGALSISSTNPGFNGCYDTAQTISVLVQNLGIDTLRFNLTPATVTCYISGAIMDTVVGNITDSLLPGATKLVTITAGVNMSALGTYTLIAKTNIAGDGDTLNDIMPAATNRTAVALVGGTISSLVTSPMCLTGSPSSSISGHSGSNIQWQSTTDTNGVWNNVGTINSVNYTPISPLTQTTYIRAKEYCNTTIDSTNILSFKILNPSVSSVTLDTVCGNGVANLGVQIANSSSVKWYTTEFGNTVVDTNLNYNTPNISSSVTYYVSANTGGASTTSLPLNPSSVGAGATSTAPQYLTFSLSSEAQIVSVDVFPTNIGTGSILIKNSTNTVTLHTIPFNNTSITNGTTPFKVFFNIVLPAGNYIMSQGSTSVSMIRNTAGATYPYIAGPLSITGNSFSTAYYYWFYNWNISTGCESPRVPVTATVLSPPKITAPREVGFCLPGAVSTQVDSASVYNNYTWSPMTGISPSGNNVNFNPSATTVYTVTATQTSGFNCVNTAQVVVKAHANPVPSITSADTIFCQSNSPAEISVLSATNRTANNWTTLLYQSFETGLNGWSISNEIGREPSSSWMVRKTPATVGTQTFNFDRDSCIVALNDSSTSLTSTYLNTPSISTIGYDSLRMSSRLIYNYATGDSLDVQASTNGGVDWVNIAGTWINFDVSLGAPAGAIVGFNLPTMFLNQADLQLRMRSKSNNGFVVGIDNIAVEGKRHATFNWTSNIGGYTSNREDSVQVRPTADAYYFVQMIDSSSGCQGRDTALVRKGLVDLTKIMNGGTSGATDSLEATCNDESTGWTYYSGTGSLSNSNFYFAINWDTNYTARSLAKAKIGTSANYILDTSDPSGSLMRGTWVMKKYWNVDLNGATLGTPVKVRFYFDPSDSATISNAAETYVNQYLNVPMRPWLEPFTWFKTVTGAYVPGANIDSSGVEMFNNVALNVESYGNENGAHYVQFSNVTSFSGGSGSSGAGIGTPLPVELLYFNAKALESGNFLYWATASEKNNSHFEIESSIDGEHFKYIGRIEGAGNSAELKTYDFTDLQPSSNRTYYRLKQVDFDGLYENSKIQVVTRDGKISFDALVYPIPARDNITIDIVSSDKGNANIIITDIAGKIIRTQSVITSLGNTQMKLNISELNAGNYIVTIDNGSERVNRKFVKVN